MDDELEDKIFYQAYISHMKILSKFAVGVSSINSPLAYIWKLCRLYLLRPEVIFCGLIIFVFLIYLQAVDVWSHGLFGRIQASLGRQKMQSLKALEINGESQCWEEVRQQSSAFAILGRRPRMEDRFIIEENINNNTGISFFAVFDGHGGEFAADFAKDILVKNIYNKIIEITTLLNQQKIEQPQQQHQQQSSVATTTDKANDIEGDEEQNDYNNYLKRLDSRKVKNSNKENNTPVVSRVRNKFGKSFSTDDSTCLSNNHNNKSNPIANDIFTSKLNSLLRNQDNTFSTNNNNYIKKANSADDSGPPPIFEAKCYLEGGKINFGKMITDEVLAADYKLVEAAKKTTNIAGTTALIAIIEGTNLIVANVGDSRGVMLDASGIAIPLSFDHKPQQIRERLRIRDAGGFITFRGVWRVAGILATSRALGDYPLKDKKLVIANPDILTFDLNDYKPSFLILASDGLWDTFSNEEACNYIKEHLKEADFGAKSLAMQSYRRGSEDNITVLVIVFRNGMYRIGSSSTSSNTTSGFIKPEEVSKATVAQTRALNSSAQKYTLKSVFQQK